jgi:hypothetical protein
VAAGPRQPRHPPPARLIAGLTRSGGYGEPAWQARRDPAATREELERQTLNYLATMPAWQDHPRVARRDG